MEAVLLHGGTVVVGCTSSGDFQNVLPASEKAYDTHAHSRIACYRILAHAYSLRALFSNKSSDVDRSYRAFLQQSIQ